MNTKQLLWDKGSAIYEDFKEDLAKKYNMPTETRTPYTHTLEEFASLRGKRLYKSLITEYLVSVGILEVDCVIKLK